MVFHCGTSDRHTVQSSTRRDAPFRFGTILFLLARICALVLKGKALFAFVNKHNLPEMKEHRWLW
jgi:hypothetical protein